jgi:hypothetical protein
MRFERWTRGVLRETLMDMTQGEDIVFIRSTIKHRAVGIGATFWVMSVTQKIIYQVSENAYGTNALKLISPGQEVKIEKQGDCEQRAKGLLVNSAYHPSNRARHTFFDLPSVPKRFQYVGNSQDQV